MRGNFGTNLIFITIFSNLVTLFNKSFLISSLSPTQRKNINNTSEKIFIQNRSPTRLRSAQSRSINPPQAPPNDRQVNRRVHRFSNPKMQLSHSHHTNPIPSHNLRPLPIFPLLTPHKALGAHLNLFLWRPLLRHTHLQIHQPPINQRLEFHHPRACPKPNSPNCPYTVCLHVAGPTEARRSHVLLRHQGVRTCPGQDRGVFDPFPGYSIRVQGRCAFADHLVGWVC